MNGLIINDIVSRKIRKISENMPLGAVKNLVGQDKYNVLIIESKDGYGYITGEQLTNTGRIARDIAEFSFKVCDKVFLGCPVEPSLNGLIAGNTVIQDGMEVIALHTPRIFLERLMELYRTQEVRMQAILNTVGEAVCMIDEENHVVFWNECAEQLYGITANEIIGVPIENFFSNLWVTKVMKEGQAIKEKYHNPRSGTHVLINANPVHSGNRIIGGVSSERNITEVVHLNKELSRTSLEVKSLKEEIDKINAESDAFSVICGHNSAILDTVRMARKVAAANIPVLLRGESGTGKELFARAIHATSRRSGKFIGINCGAIPFNLFESELFGYQAGAFTGADRKGKAGLFEMAHGGTLFLDEIGELPREMQVKLLRVLQESSFYRVGGDKPISVNVRIIAATNRDLEKMIVLREFRDDLYYRLNVVTMYLSPLRERREDIPELVHRGLQHFGHVHNKKIVRVEPAVMAALS